MFDTNMVDIHNYRYDADANVSIGGTLVYISWTVEIVYDVVSSHVGTAHKSMSNGEHRN